MENIIRKAEKAERTQELASPVERLVMCDDSPDFVMSKFLNLEDLYKAKAEHYQAKYEKLLRAFNDDLLWLQENIEEMNIDKDNYVADDHIGLPYSLGMFKSVLHNVQKDT